MTDANRSDKNRSDDGSTGRATYIDVPPEALAARLLDWYDRHHRRLPWRSEPGQTADPYHVWLSEIMLQQTTVAAVGTYFRRLVELWPSVHDLAAAPRDDVQGQCQGTRLA